MKTNPKAKRKYIVSKCENLRLWFQPKYKQWIMTGGKFGIHYLFEPNVYNSRVATHWMGYIKNNGLSSYNMTFNDY
jgi:hypothetical protein